ncbi:MAG: hypothetical protein ACM3S2_06030 [Ignavibacteriales bacterium]
MKHFYYLLVCLFLLPISLFSQNTAGTEASDEPEFLIDMPTAGILGKGNVGTNFYLMPTGVLISRLEVGVFDNFSFGISYGASNFIGSGSPLWFKLPGVSVKIKIIDESEGLPSVALGFDSQGKGDFIKTLDNREVNRFKIKSPGFYGAVSKNFQFLGYLGLHGTVNYSLEGEDGDKDLNLTVGIEKTIGNRLSVVTEYDFAINDNTGSAFGGGNGYLNAGLRWAMGDGFTVGFDLRDLLNNKKLNPGTADRALKVEFIKPIF